MGESCSKVGFMQADDMFAVPAQAVTVAARTTRMQCLRSKVKVRYSTEMQGKMSRALQPPGRTTQQAGLPTVNRLYPPTGLRRLPSPPICSAPLVFPNLCSHVTVLVNLLSFKATAFVIMHAQLVVCMRWCFSGPQLRPADILVRISVSGSGPHCMRRRRE